MFEEFERSRIHEDLRYDNLNAFVQLQNKEIANIKVLIGNLLKRVEQLEIEAKVHSLKKMLGSRAK